MELQELVSRGKFLFNNAPKRFEVFKLVNGKRSSKDISLKIGRPIRATLDDLKKMREMELIIYKVDKNGELMKKDDSAIYEKNPIIRNLSMSYFSNHMKNVQKDLETKDKERIEKIKPTRTRSNKKPKEKVRILILASDPANLINIEQCREVRLINNLLKGDHNFVRPYIELASCKQELVDILTKYKPNIVHFIGHGNPEGKLYLKDEITGEKQELDIDTLSKLFELIDEHLQCVFLNACYTDITATEIAKHAECVIGMTRTIDDDIAPLIAKGFYIGIKNGLSVQKAINAGKVQALTALKIEDSELGEEIEKPKCLAGRKDPKDVYIIKQSDIE